MSVGAPEWVYLEKYGEMIRVAFGAIPYHVGSSLTQKVGWRDVDVRIIMNDVEWEHCEFGEPDNPSKKCVAFNVAFSELGRKMTGLPIDFQIQQQTYANKNFPPSEHPRSAIGILWGREKT
jgi:hypothetical protein